MRSFAALLLFLPILAAAQQPTADKDAASDLAGVSPALPHPTMGWVLGSNGASIPNDFGTEPLESSETAAKPALALDGAGNIDSAALAGGVPSGKPVDRYALTNASEATLTDGTTVMLLCGRENNWLRSESGVRLSSTAPVKEFSVAKPGEWGLTLVSADSPFAVVAGGQWVYANAPPTPSSYARFSKETAFPAFESNTQVCVWAFYDTSIEGSRSRPEISVAYDDGPAGTPVPILNPVAESSSPLQVALSSEFGADLGTLFIWQGSAAAPLFQQSVRAAYWNQGMRKSIRSGFETATWSGLAITNLNPLPIALGGDALDNVGADFYQGFVRTSPFAHYSLTTTAGTPFVVVRYQLGNTAYQPYQYSVSFVLDGDYLGYDQPWRFGTNLRSIPLPQDGRSHTVDIRNGFTRNNANYATPTRGGFGGGGFIDAVAVPKGYKIKVNHPEPSSVALVLSHSVAVGELAGTRPYQGQGPQSSVAWTVQARAAHAFGTESVVVDAYGGELLANDCGTQTACTNYLAGIKKAQPNIKVGFVARMLNDFYHGQATFGECLTDYQQDLEYLFNAWHEVFPGIPLHVGSDIRESIGHEAEFDRCTPSGNLADWRAGIESAVTQYKTSNDANWLHFVDMTDWVPQSELLAGGLHPDVQGQVAICQQIAKYFRQNVACGVPR